MQPNHLETVIARLDGKLWKYTRHFDNPQFRTTPGTPPQRIGPDFLDPPPQGGSEDVVSLQRQPSPTAPGHLPIEYEMTVKNRPASDEYEMYDVTDDPLELHNLYNAGRSAAVQAVLAALLREQCASKRLVPCSGTVPGQPQCGQQHCTTWRPV